MRRLILLRHAKSDWPQTVSSDHERPLAERGRQAAPIMAAWLASHGYVPDQVAVSTARRTQETWELSASAFPGVGAPVLTDAIYEARWSDVLSFVQQTSNMVKTLLIVGHNPGLQELAARLAGSGDAAARARLSAGFPTAAAAVLDADVDDWAALAPGRAALVTFVTPRDAGAPAGS